MGGRKLDTRCITLEANIMTGIPGVPKAPEDLINYVFNLDQGSHIYAHCDTCGKVTEQVIVSYNQLPSMRKQELKRVMGRLLDIIPFTRFVIGKAIFCGTCRTVKLSLGHSNL